MPQIIKSHLEPNKFAIGMYMLFISQALIYTTHFGYSFLRNIPAERDAIISGMIVLVSSAFLTCLLMCILTTGCQEPLEQHPFISSLVLGLAGYITMYLVPWTWWNICTSGTPLAIICLLMMLSTFVEPLANYCLPYRPSKLTNGKAYKSFSRLSALHWTLYMVFARLTTITSAPDAMAFVRFNNL